MKALACFECLGQRLLLVETPEKRIECGLYEAPHWIHVLGFVHVQDPEGERLRGKWLWAGRPLDPDDRLEAWLADAAPPPPKPRPIAADDLNRILCREQLCKHSSGRWLLFTNAFGDAEARQGQARALYGVPVEARRTTRRQSDPAYRRETRRKLVPRAGATLVAPTT